MRIVNAGPEAVGKMCSLLYLIDFLYSIGNYRLYDENRITKREWENEAEDGENPPWFQYLRFDEDTGEINVDLTLLEALREFDLNLPQHAITYDTLYSLCADHEAETLEYSKQIQAALAVVGKITGEGGDS